MPISTFGPEVFDIRSEAMQYQLMEAMDCDNIAKLSHIWRSNSQDEDGHALGFLTHATEGWAELAKQGVVPGRCKATPWQQHGSDAKDPRLSLHSSYWCKLLKMEWYTSDITCKFRGDGAECCTLESEDTATRYHGTTLKAVVSMIEKGGFIPGINGHGRKGKYLLGLFSADSIGEAIGRVDPWREAKGTGREAHLDLLGCPVVVELQVASCKLHRYHGSRRDLRVFQVRPAFLCLASSWLACTSIIASSGIFASVDACQSEGKKYVVKAAAIRIVASASHWSSKASFAKDGSKKGSDLNQNQASRIASAVTQATARVRRTCAKNLQIFMHKHGHGHEHAADDA